jgi:hypothetical protein
MPRPNFEDEIRVMKNEALHFMQEGRAANAAIRAVKRSWKYKEGKKTAIRVGTATLVTLAGVGVGVATHGLGLPVLMAVAGGMLAVGKMSEGSIAALYGREYHGATRTQGFITEYRHRDDPVDFESDGEAATSLAARAHTTIRRACLHYRKAWKKLEALRQKPVQISSCDDAAERLTLLLQAKHHYDKAWLYIQPACFLSRAMFNCYKAYWDYWRGDKQEASMGKTILSAMSMHEEDKKPCCSEVCYWESVPKKEVTGSHQNNEEHLWNHPQWREKKLDDAEKILLADPVCLAAISVKNPNFHEGTPILYFNTLAANGKRGILVKLKHKVQNAWDKKTGGEKGALAVGQVVSAANAFAGPVIPDLLILKDLAQQGAETLVDLAIDPASEAIGKRIAASKASADQGTPPVKSSAGRELAKETQESLQRAAIHLWEAAEVYERLDKRTSQYRERFADDDLCGAVVDMMAEQYKIKHHLFKAQKPLEESIEMVERCAKALKKEFPELKKQHDQLVDRINIFMCGVNHDRCKSHCIYG